MTRPPKGSAARADRVIGSGALRAVVRARGRGSYRRSTAEILGEGPAQRMPQPQHIAVIGAGLVGLAAAWHLQEQGRDVTVLERRQVAAGASWGNAGWLTPSLATPLPEPAVLRYGVRALTSPASPVYLPVSTDPGLLRFLAGFVRNSTTRRWEAAMRAHVPLNRRALEAFDELAAGGVAAPTYEASPLLIAFRGADERAPLLSEFARMHEAGQAVDFDLLEADETHQVEPALSEGVRAAIRIHGQRFINPPEYVRSLADAVRARGGALREGTAVRAVRDNGVGVVLTTSDGAQQRFDAVVVAVGTHIGPLVRPYGVRQVVQAGRGYSFSVEGERTPSGPVYFPHQRVACTPLGSRLRVAGMMEFRRPEAPIDPRRIDAIVRAVRPLLAGVDLDTRKDEWVGSRPVTPDGLPLVGPTRSPRVFVAGGHGMWGIVLGPLTGRLIAETVTTGVAPPELTPLHPLR